jgi:NAD(P)-dependent dehydrogenase (short-subunit alcohol dehydrogenase family)
MDARWRRAIAALSRLGRSVGSYLSGPLPVRRPAAPEPIAGKLILVTGASSGIGRSAAAYLASQGATVLLVARREGELALLHQEIIAAGGRAAYRRCDLSDRDELSELVRWVLDEHGGVDVLINNAARSMRRPLSEALERLDDFDRAMAVNFFGPVRLTMGLLPTMLRRGSGHVVNVSTWTVPVGTSPRFAAYHSSKAALAGFGRCVNAELARRGVRVTNVHYPLVHTPMSAPTEKYRALPGLTPDKAARWIASAIRFRPVRMVPRYVVLLRIADATAPRLVDRILMRWG